MAGDGTTFEIDIETRADSVEPAAAALARLEAALTQAGAASTAAAEAVKAGEDSYRQAEVSADRAAKSLEKISLAADAQRGKLQAALDAGDTSGADKAAAKLENLLARQQEAEAKAAAASAALTEEAQALDELKAAATAAAANEERLSAQMEAEATAAEEAAAAQEAHAEATEGGSINLRALSGALGHLGGPLGVVGQQATAVGGAIQRMSRVLGDAGPYVGAAVLAVAVAAAFAAATIAITKWSISLSDANRTTALLNAGIAGTVAGGAALTTKINDLSSRVPQSSAELQQMASDLAKTGLKGEALGNALEAAAVKAAKAKFGPEWQKQMLSLDKQSEVLHKNVANLFGGLNLDGLLGGLQKIIGLFDSTSTTGKAIKLVFESIFQPLINQLTALEPEIVKAFIQFEIWALKALIAIKPFGPQIAAVFKAILVTVAVVGAAVAAAVAVMVVAFAAVLAAPKLLSDAFESLGRSARELGTSIIGGAGGAVDWLRAKFDEVTSFLSGISLSEIGAQIIQGLVDGITGAGSKVLGSVTGVVGGAIDAAKSALGIASPSKVFAEIGAHTAEGMATGVEGGSGDVQSSLEGMVEPPATGNSPTANARASGGGNTYYIEINAPGGDGPSIAGSLRELLADLGVQDGGAVPA